MNGNWHKIVKNGVLYGAASAVLFTGLFPMLCIANDFGSDMVMGAVAGGLSGLLVSLVVGMVDQASAHREILTGSVVWAGLNPIVGLLAGVVITTIVIILMVQTVGFMGNNQVPMVFGVPLCLLVGTPLGIIIGLPIGASWQYS